MKPLNGAEAEQLAEEILDNIGDGMSENFAALPDLIWEHCEAYQRMDLEARKATVQAVAEAIAGEGYVYTYPVT